MDKTPVHDAGFPPAPRKEQGIYVPRSKEFVAIGISRIFRVDVHDAEIQHGDDIGAGERRPAVAFPVMMMVMMMSFRIS